MYKAFVLLGLPVAVGCSATVGSPEAADADTSSVAAVVVVEQSTGPGEAAHTESVARFLRTKGGIDAMARAMVGEKLDLPAVGECKGISPGDGTAPSRPLELLDVGAITIAGQSSHASLVARRVPDVVDLVSGVVYTSRDAPAFGGRVVVHAAGSSDLEGFSVPADAPPAIDGLHVGGSGSGNTTDASAVVIAAAASHVDLSWNAGADLVYVDIAQGRTPASTRCAFGDEGVGSLPASALGDDGTIAVHRVRQSALRARGIDEGSLRFDVARVVSYVRR